jgi:hypothetical protein
LVIISYTTGLSFAEERIGPLAAIVTTVFYLLALYLLVLPNTLENPFASIWSETLIKTTSQHLLLLVGFDTLIYQKYYDTPPILVGHHRARIFLALLFFPRNQHEKKKHTRGPTRPKRDQVAQARGQVVPLMLI